MSATSDGVAAPAPTRPVAARAGASAEAAGRRGPVGFVRALWRELLGFSAVGLVGVVFDITTFNVVGFGLHAPRVAASLAGTSLGTLVSYLGNRYWVFRRRQLRQSRTEILLFLLVSVIGIGITAGCVAFNSYVLGYDGVIASNIAQFVFGQGLGSLFRFWGMHALVFPEARQAAAPAAAPADAAAERDDAQISSSASRSMSSPSCQVPSSPRS